MSLALPCAPLPVRPRVRRHRGRHVLAAVAAAGPAVLFPETRIVGLGSLCQDMVVDVDHLPREDEKIRAERTTLCGGGNAANALTAAARLGARCSLWTKLGRDATADALRAELAADGVETDLVASAPGTSAFTYIMVDAATATRTCIHSPGPAATPDDLTPAAASRLLDGASLALFDGRLAECGLILALAAVASRIPVLVEAERPRSGLGPLLELGDVVVASRDFPSAATAAAGVAPQDYSEALVWLLRSLPRCRLLVTTRGADGAVALQACPPPAPGAPPAPSARLRDVLAALERGSPPPQPPGSFAAAAAAPAAAVPGSPPTRSYGPVMLGPGLRPVIVHRTPAASPPPPWAVADTTGCGDAFIGALACALARQVPPAGALRLAAWVAAAKCRAPGARAGLPRAAELPKALAALLRT